MWAKNLQQKLLRQQQLHVCHSRAHVRRLSSKKKKKIENKRAIVTRRRFGRQKQQLRFTTAKKHNRLVNKNYESRDSLAVVSHNALLKPPFVNSLHCWQTTNLSLLFVSYLSAFGLLCRLVFILRWSYSKYSRAGVIVFIRLSWRCLH